MPSSLSADCAADNVRSGVHGQTHQTSLAVTDKLLGMEELLYWSLIAIALGIVFFVIEVFVPTGGVAGGLAALSAIVGVVLMFFYDSTYGLVAAVFVIVLTPFAVGLAMYVLPDTPIAKMLTLKDGISRSEQAEAKEREEHQSMIGKQGLAATDLRPVGVCVIDGKRLDCVAGAGMIEKGEKVEVTLADGMQIKVRAVRES